MARKDLRDALPGGRHLIEVHPHNGAHRAALRAGASVAIPLLALWLGGRLAWAPAAAFGSLTSIYGRAEPHAARLRMQLQAGAALTLAVTIGTAVGCSPDRRWLSVLAVTACAAAGSLAADRLRWHPSGPIFIVFSSATLASHAATPARVPVACAVTAATALLAALIGTAGWLRLAARRARRAAGRPAASSTPAAVPAAGQPPSASHSWQWTQAARYGIAVLAAGAVATAIGTGHPYWSIVAAVAAVTGPDTAARLTRAVHRVAGTVLGVLVAAAILAPHLPVLAVIGVITVLQGATELAVGRNYALAVIFLTPLALIMGTLSQPVSEWVLLHDRTIETLLGAAVGVAIGVAGHRHRAQTAMRELDRSLDNCCRTVRARRHRRCVRVLPGRQREHARGASPAAGAIARRVPAGPARGGGVTGYQVPVSGRSSAAMRAASAAGTPSIRKTASAS